MLPIKVPSKMHITHNAPLLLLERGGPHRQSVAFGHRVRVRMNVGHALVDRSAPRYLLNEQPALVRPSYGPKTGSDDDEA